MPKHLRDPLRRIHTLIARAEEEDRRIVVALAGFPGSGKSTRAEKWEESIRAQAGEGKFQAVGMDGFHLTRAQLATLPDPETALARRGAPYTFDPKGFAAKVRELLDAANVRDAGWPGFEHAIGDPVPDAVTVPAGCRVILVEGIYTLLREGKWAELAPLFDETWFLDVPIETAMQRLCRRHREAWGLTPEEARRRADGNDRLNCQFIAPCRDAADFIVAAAYGEKTQ